MQKAGFIMTQLKMCSKDTQNIAVTLCKMSLKDAEKMTNSADPGQELVWKQSDLGLYRLLGPTCQETKKNHGNVFIIAIFIQLMLLYVTKCMMWETVHSLCKKLKTSLNLF